MLRVDSAEQHPAVKDDLEGNVPAPGLSKPPKSALEKAPPAARLQHRLSVAAVYGLIRWR